MSPMRPHELRQLLEDDARAALEENRASGQPVDATFLAGTVLARHQHREEVQGRLNVLWSYLETYVLLLATSSRGPP